MLIHLLVPTTRGCLYNFPVAGRQTLTNVAERAAISKLWIWAELIIAAGLITPVIIMGKGHRFNISSHY